MLYHYYYIQPLVLVSANINGGLSGGIFDNNLSLVLISKLSVRVLLEVNLDVLCMYYQIYRVYITC